MSKRFEHTLAFHCGPAILGIKASNLINLSLADYPNILDEIKHLIKFLILIIILWFYLRKMGEYLYWYFSLKL